MVMERVSAFAMKVISFLDILVVTYAMNVTSHREPYRSSIHSTLRGLPPFDLPGDDGMARDGSAAGNAVQCHVEIAMPSFSPTVSGYPPYVSSFLSLCVAIFG